MDWIQIAVVSFLDDFVESGYHCIPWSQGVRDMGDGEGHNLQQPVAKSKTYKSPADLLYCGLTISYSLL